MSEWFPMAHRRGGAGDEPEHTVHVDPTRALEESRRRWQVRSAQWRARALAESVFGGEVRVRIEGAGGAGGGRGVFRGMLHLEVPFQGLDVHRWRERIFQACAADDPVLAAVPLIYVFRPASADGAASESGPEEATPPRPGSADGAPSGPGPASATGSPPDPEP